MNLRAFFSTFQRDLLAGTVVFLVALPLCLGIANASGVEPFAGLVSGIVGGLVVAVLSGSRLSVSGPAAGLVVIVIDGIAQLGSFSAFLLAVLLSGAIQFGFGMLKAGRFAAYVPSPVIKGMLAAIGVLLIVKQFPLALGLSGTDAAAAAQSVAHAAGSISTPFGSISLAACVITLLSLAILVGWETRALRRFVLVRRVPAPLAVVLLGIGATLLLSVLAPSLAPPAEHRVALPPLESFAALQLALEWADFGPHFAQLVNPDVWRVAITLAIVASLETLLSLEAVEQIDPERRAAPPDRELKAQGVGNLIAGAIGGLPITSVIVRSSANVHAGAQSRLSAIIHGVLLLVSVFALTSVINLIPLACLAAILIFTGLKLAKPSLFVAVAKQGFAPFAPFIVTLVGVLATDLLIGIVLGTLCSVLLALYANLRSPIVLAQHGDHYLLSFRKDVSFLGKVPLKHYLQQIPDGATLIVDATRADFVDHDVRDLLDTFVADAPGRGIAVEVRHQVQAQARASRGWSMRRTATE
ncbi:sulfate permease-like transporter, MFS superfamily [Burkholderia sp. Ch1-1]|uniref:Sulfate permease-like transporter, MFS superfamily n=1 Tax=Paraburkholderia dioscoreae TaxID=2604047 RepID=A0A5Q4YUZ1_9BURK|nr:MULTISPECIES: SulP family inorganic anion transporter [Paraburkholderia]EIF32397.1 sulfate permease-like transporter, MFS superfamily [Burkholderia sp. Ch1-1]MDR8401259.1 SulP family inorganic anion transporter [Paraburkholderia sp. USG1]VVD27770.1 Sulfate permease-like transporter, MFS superfamily [Paraburkholderia dioscoreae]